MHFPVLISFQQYLVCHVNDCKIAIQFQQDFEVMYPGKADCMTNVWPDLSSKMIPAACRSKDKEAVRLQRLMCSSNSPGVCHFT